MLMCKIIACSLCGHSFLSIVGSQAELVGLHGEVLMSPHLKVLTRHPRSHEQDIIVR